MIDTLMYVKKLEAIGVPREQAELQVQVMAEIVDQNYATKQDFKDLRTDMNQEFKDLRTDINQDFKNVRQEMHQEFKNVRAEMNQEFKAVRHEMQLVEQRLTIKLGSIMMAGMTALALIIKFF